MKKDSVSQSAFFHPRILIALVFCSIGAFLMLLGFGPVAQGAKDKHAVTFQAVASYHNDVSARLRDLALLPVRKAEHESNKNPKIPFHHKDSLDPVVQNQKVKSQLGPVAPSMPNSILSFLGIGFPGVNCNCHPPDTNGAIGSTQYVQIVNEGYQVFNKSTGASVLGPNSISSLWAGFGGVCETGGAGDPVVLYDHLSNRWVITQFAGSGSAVTDECVAVSTTSDATGTYNRYGFHLGTNFFDYPKLSVWPDAYYMSMNIFNPAGTSYLGPQPFALDRTAMLAGSAATFVSPVAPLGSTVDPILPADLDGSTLPPSGAPETFVGFPGSGVYNVYHFHVDFATPANSTWSTFATPAAAGFTQLCSSTQACVPEVGVTTADYLDGLGDRLMFRLPYRNFGDHESLVGNYSVSAGGVAGVRWFELRNVTSGPVTVYQESTYQPDSTWRWMGSAAMDHAGNMAIGFSASSASINPQIRYAGRLAGDSLNTLGQGEATLVAGTGSQTGSGNRWGDYSAMTVDPVDDTTFWFTSEYYIATGTSWQTRIGSFKFVSAPNPIADTSTVTADNCNSNGVIDPNELVTVSLGIKNTGTINTSNLVATLQATGGVTSQSGPQTYGVVTAGGATVSRSFTFTAGNVTCGSSVVATLQLQDGATNFGTITYNFTTGTLSTSFSETFDVIVAPALPAGWVAANASGAAPLWVTSATTPDAGSNDAFVDDPTTVSDKRLDTPAISVSSASAQLSFRNNYNLESTFDGGVLEVSSPNINAGAFTDITDASVGGSFASGGYNATISTLFSSPIAGRQAWSGSSGGYLTTVANLGPNVVGQTIKLRFRMGSDTSVGVTGWRIDTIKVLNGAFCCGAPTPTPTPTPSPSPVIASGGSAALTGENFTPANNAPDPGEYVTVNLPLVNTGTGNTTNLVGTLQATGGVTNPSAPQTYGVVVAGGATVSRSFSFIASGTCGNNITLTLALQDGATNLGTVTYTLRLGTLSNGTIFSEAFDGVSAPGLPAGWTTTATGGESAWVTSTTNPNSSPNDAFAPDVTTVGNTELVTPTIVVPAGGGTLTFRNLFNMEASSSVSTTGYDGMVLEISINAGAFADITTGGNAFTAGGYTRTISSSFSSPLAGRLAWSGLSGGTITTPTYITSTINLPAAAAGQNIQLKWRAATDSSAVASGAAGVRIDGISLSGATISQCVSNQAPAIVNGPPPSPVIVGTPYSFAFAASGNPAPTFSVAGALPPGLGLSTAGVLSGTATSGGTGSFPSITVTASNAVAPNAMQTFALNTVTQANNYIASFGLSGSDAVLTFDYDHDGLTNLLEYALGLDPTVAGLSGLPTVTLKDYAGTMYLSMLFHRSSLATDLTYIVQGSSDLVSWTDLATSSAGGTTNGAGFVTETGSAPAFTVEVRDTVPYDPLTLNKRFLRLRITSP